MSSGNTKLFGKDLSAYDDIDIDDLLDQLSPEELELLAGDVDPDVSSSVHDIESRLFWN